MKSKANVGGETGGGGGKASSNLLGKSKHGAIIKKTKHALKKSKNLKPDKTNLKLIKKATKLTAKERKQLAAMATTIPSKCPKTQKDPKVTSSDSPSKPKATTAPATAVTPSKTKPSPAKKKSEASPSAKSPTPAKEGKDSPNKATPKSPSKKGKSATSEQSTTPNNKQASPSKTKNTSTVKKTVTKDAKEQKSPSKKVGLDSPKKSKADISPENNKLEKNKSTSSETESSKNSGKKCSKTSNPPSRDPSPKKLTKVNSSDPTVKKRGRPKGSRNKAKDPTDTPKTKPTPNKKSKSPKSKDTQNKVSDIKLEDGGLDSADKKEPKSASVDHYTYNTDETSSEYEDLSARRKAMKLQKTKTDKKPKGSKSPNKMNASPKYELSSGWDTVSDVESGSSSKKVIKKEFNPNVQSAIDSVLRKLNFDSENDSSCSTPSKKVNKEASTATKQAKSKVDPPKSENKKVDPVSSSDEDVESDEEDQPIVIKKSASLKRPPKKSKPKPTTPKSKQKSSNAKKTPNKGVTFASEDEESHKDSDSDEDTKPGKKRKVRTATKSKVITRKKPHIDVSPPSPPRRVARMASLNALAVMHCMNEDARMPLHVSSHRSEPKKQPQQPPPQQQEMSLVLRQESTIAKRHTDDDSDDESEDDHVEIRYSGSKRKKEEQINNKVKKVRKKRRGELDVQMDIRDMVVTKRIASLNASAIMAVSYGVESRRRTPITAASSSAESEVTNLNIKRKISYKSTKSKGTKSRSVITVQETTKKLKKAQGTRETEVEERIIVKKKVKRHSGRNTADDTEREEDDATDASEINQDEIIPKSPDDSGMIVESTITYISTQTDTSPQTVSVSGVSSYCISSGEGKTTTVVQQVERKSKTTTKCTSYSSGTPPTAFIPPTHVQPVCPSSAVSPTIPAKSHTSYSPLGALSGMQPNMEQQLSGDTSSPPDMMLSTTQQQMQSYPPSPHPPTHHLHHHHHHIHAHPSILHHQQHPGYHHPNSLPPPPQGYNNVPSSQQHPPPTPPYLQPHSPPYPPPPLPSSPSSQQPPHHRAPHHPPPPMLMPPNSSQYSHHHHQHHHGAAPPTQQQHMHQQKMQQQQHYSGYPPGMQGMVHPHNNTPDGGGAMQQHAGSPYPPQSSPKDMHGHHTGAAMIPPQRGGPNNMTPQQQQKFMAQQKAMGGAPQQQQQHAVMQHPSMHPQRNPAQQQQQMMVHQQQSQYPMHPPSKGAPMDQQHMRAKAPATTTTSAASNQLMPGADQNFHRNNNPYGTPPPPRQQMMSAQQQQHNRGGQQPPPGVGRGATPFPNNNKTPQANHCGNAMNQITPYSQQQQHMMSKGRGGGTQRDSEGPDSRHESAFTSPVVTTVTGPVSAGTSDSCCPAPDAGPYPSYGGPDSSCQDFTAYSGGPLNSHSLRQTKHSAAAAPQQQQQPSPSVGFNKQQLVRYQQQCYGNSQTQQQQQQHIGNGAERTIQRVNVKKESIDVPVQHHHQQMASPSLGGVVPAGASASTPHAPPPDKTGAPAALPTTASHTACQSPDSSDASLTASPAAASSSSLNSSPTDPLVNSSSCLRGAKDSSTMSEATSSDGAHKHTEENSSISATIANLLKLKSCTITSAGFTASFSPSSRNNVASNSSNTTSLSSNSSSSCSAQDKNPSSNAGSRDGGMEMKLSPQVPSINSTTNVPLSLPKKNSSNINIMSSNSSRNVSSVDESHSSVSIRPANAADNREGSVSSKYNSDELNTPSSSCLKLNSLDAKKSISSALPLLSASIGAASSKASIEESAKTVTAAQASPSQQLSSDCDSAYECSSDVPLNNGESSCISKEAELSVANDLLLLAEKPYISSNSINASGSSLTVSSTSNMDSDGSASISASEETPGTVSPPVTAPNNKTPSSSPPVSSSHSKNSSPSPRSRHLLCQMVPAHILSKTATARAKPLAVAGQGRVTPIKSELITEPSFANLVSGDDGMVIDDASEPQAKRRCDAANSTPAGTQRKRGRPPKARSGTPTGDATLRMESKNGRSIGEPVIPQPALVHQYKLKNAEEKVSSKKLPSTKPDLKESKLNLSSLDVKKSLPVKTESLLPKIKSEKVSPTSVFSVDSHSSNVSNVFKLVNGEEEYFTSSCDADKLKSSANFFANSSTKTQLPDVEELKCVLTEHSKQEGNKIKPGSSTKKSTDDSKHSKTDSTSSRDSGNKTTTKSPKHVAKAPAKQTAKAVKASKKSTESTSRCKKSLLAYLKEKNESDSSNIDSDVPNSSIADSTPGSSKSPTDAKKTNTKAPGPSTAFPSSFQTGKTMRRRQSSGSSKGKVVKKPKWVHGWKWEGEPFQGKVWLRNDEILINRTCYTAMKHKEGDLVRVRDCVLLRSGPRKADLPFVAKVAALWEDPDTCDMMMSILWYYRPEHTEIGRQDHDLVDEIFASKHRDHLSVACIEDTCYVLTFNEYCRYQRSLRQSQQKVSSHLIPCVVPEDEVEYPREQRQPPCSVVPELLFFCRKVYDYRQKRILKNPC